MQAECTPPAQCKTVGSLSNLVAGEDIQTSSKSRDPGVFPQELADQTRAKTQVIIGLGFEDSYRKPTLLHFWWMSEWHWASVWELIKEFNKLVYYWEFVTYFWPKAKMCLAILSDFPLSVVAINLYSRCKSVNCWRIYTFIFFLKAFLTLYWTF